ncbi:MAG: DMT family transporter [Hydrogenovibrio crunogenus]|uniref:Drug/metabolite (DMT) superfamily transporter n=1 Tax=Hydrogenovibrio crunogenus (strain DSM 25203 / XCL-2) TaxID=317025 RepID=Q31GR0_HYDCU|nr:DMT family transporter [Hydrogenovibrio crunogenus]
MSPALLVQTALFTLFAMIAFAANAVICRWALDGGWIDPVSFTSLRLGSGAASLFIVMTLFAWKGSQNKIRPSSETNVSKGSWKAAFILFVYALTFSYGYVAISTATGALILAGVVQLTMIGYALKNGDKLHGAEWVGVALALMGLLYLMYPKLTTPSWWGLVMVIISAYTWALYSLNGRHSLAPLKDTAYNFYRTLPMIAIASGISLLFVDVVHLTPFGVGMAIFSGGVTSGLGYILWYKALPRISSSLASAAQLLVPLFAAIGATLLISEPITLRLTLAAIMMLGGLALVIIGRNQHRKAAIKKLSQSTR